MPDGNFDPDSLLAAPAPPSATMTVRPRRKLDRDETEKLVRKYNPDITDAAVKGEVDNIVRESGGNAANDTGDGGTSGGLYQHHNTRLEALKQFASKEKSDWTDPDIQVRFSRMEKERDYPSLLKLQQTSDDRAQNEDAFKRIFERPASVLWGNDASGRPVPGSAGYRFSDYATKEHDGRPNTDMLMMTPQEYLDLSPELSGKPFESPSGRSLMKSFNRGDPIEAVPTLDVKVNGPTATVTDQDGRHRALLAQQEGIEAIPVAVRKSGEGDPKEIVGMTGTMMAHDFPKVADAATRQAVQTDKTPPKTPISLFPQAQAAEPARDAAGQPVDAVPGGEWWKQGAVPAQPATQAAQPNQPAAAPPDGEWWKQGADAPQNAPLADASGQGQDQFADPSKPDLGSVIGGDVEDAALRVVTGGAAPPGLGRFLINPDTAAAVTRAAAPYAAGAVGGALIGGPGGAIAGAGLTGLGQTITGLMGVKTPQDVTDAALDMLGVRRPQTATGRIAEQATAGAANALSGAGAVGQLAVMLKNPLSRAVANVLAENKTLQTASGALSGATSQIAAELHLPQALQQVAGLVAGLAPGAKGLAPNMWRVNASPAAKAAIQEGFALHPADATEGHIGEMNLSNMAAADAGKTKTGQMASAVNQPRVNLKAQQEIGLPPGTTLYPDVLKAVRAREAGTYKELYDAVPQVDLGGDPVFKENIGKIGERLKKLVEQFPHIKTLPDGVGQQIENFQRDLTRQAAGDTRTVMDYLGELRRQASHNINRPNNAVSARLGLAQREAAQEIEDAVGRSIERAPDFYRQRLAAEHQLRDEMVRERVEQGLPLQGGVIDQIDARIQNLSDKMALANSRDQNNTTLLDRWRKARKTIAQTHDIEAVTNPSSGDVSAVGLFNLMKNGRPLTGNLKAIADAAGNFRRSFQNPAAFGGVEPLSILDAAYSAAQGARALATGSVGHGVAAILPWLRHPFRTHLMSDARQNAMIAPYKTPTVPLSALSTPLLPTQPTGNALADQSRGN